MISIKIKGPQCETTACVKIVHSSQARNSHVARVAHAPPVRGLFFFGRRVSRLHMPRVMELRLASCLPYLDTILHSHTTCILVEFPWHSTSLLSSIQTTSPLPYLDTIMHSHHTCSRPPMAQTLSFKYRCIFFHRYFIFHFLFHFFLLLHLSSFKNKLIYTANTKTDEEKQTCWPAVAYIQNTAKKWTQIHATLSRSDPHRSGAFTIDFDAEHYFLRPAAESLSLVHAHQSGAASRSCAVRVQQKGKKKHGARHDEHSGRARSCKTRRENRSSLLFLKNFSSRILAHLGRCVFVTHC